MKLKDMEILIGSDPELFVKKDDVIISGHTLIEGTKDKPFPVEGGAVQVDGTALEFNTNPAKTKAEFNRTSALVIENLRNMIPPELELAAIPTAHFARKYMEQLPEEAKMLGCSPDFNAYTGKENPTPDGDVLFRTGAGHIHIGWTNVENPYSPRHMDECRAIVQAMDVFLGAPSVLIDNDKLRRSLYGKAGAFRPKSYGVEYRVLSNFWVLDEELRGWVFDNTILALRRLLSLADPLTAHRGYPAEAINTSSHFTAMSVVKQYSVPLPRGL